MHALVYRTEILRQSGIVLPEHTFYVDNLFAYCPLPYVRNIFYMDIDLYQYYLGRDDQSVNEQMLKKRIDQQMKVTRMVIAGAFPTAEYRICELDCTGEQKEAIRERLHKDYKNRFHMHYAAAGLLALLCHRKFYLKNQYTCSSYLAEVLGEQGIFISEKHFSLVTPKDVCEYKNCRVVFEGRLSDLIVREEQAVAYET